MTSVYIHIPFCERICFYCDFPKRVGKSDEIDLYLNALEKEVMMYEVKEKIDTLYIGGGTPSLLNINQLIRLKKIIDLFKINENYEFTIECNPEHLTDEKVKMFKNMGINRVSLGVQTFHQSLLSLLNRQHTKEMVYQAVHLLRKYGIENINMDLMFSIPNQKLDDVWNDISHIKQLDVPHISYYSLILEDKTVLKKMIKDNKIKLLDNEIEASMYHYILDELKALGYKHYEISNFSKEGFQSQHNQVYWQNKEYYGFGMGASGYIDNIRYYNEDRVNHYLEKLNKDMKPIKTRDLIKKDDKLKEALLLGLRLINGILIDDINNKYGVDIEAYFKKEFKYLIDKGFIKVSDRIKLTDTGLFYGNEVFEWFI